MTLTERNEKLDMMLKMIDSYKKQRTTPSREVFKAMGDLYITLRDAQIEYSPEEETENQKYTDEKVKEHLRAISGYIEHRI